MKKIIGLMLLFIAVKAHSQNGIIFKIHFLPEHKYKSTITMDMNMDMDFSGDSLIIKKIKEKGIKMPMIMASNSTMDAEIITGVVRKENDYPVDIKYVDMETKKTLNGEDQPEAQNPIIGATIHGHMSGEGKMSLDSISGKSMEENEKAAIESTITNLMDQTKFPDKPLNIGDSFTQEVPFNLPLLGSTMQMIIKINYKLTSIVNNNAFFSLDEKMDFDMSTTKDAVEIKMTGMGVGNGKLVYDIANNYPTLMKSIFDFSYQMEAGKLHLSGKAKIVSTHITEIDKTSK